MPFKIEKKNGELVYTNIWGYESRNSSTFWCLKNADAIYNWDDFNEIIIHTDDFEADPSHFTYSKKDSYNRLIPDFNFHGWPQVGINDYEETIQEIDRAGKNPCEINKVGWIGNSLTNKYRQVFLDIANQHPSLFEATDMRWCETGQTRLNATIYKSLPELVKTYGILIDIEGGGYSGRLKYLLWSHRPVLLVDRPHKEFFFEYLVPWKHYIPVRRDLSDVVEKTQWCIDHPNDAHQIAEHAYVFSQTYLTRNACYEQWNKVIQTK